MLEKYVFGKAAVFIDAANIYYSQKSLKWKIDFQKLKHYLEEEIKVNQFLYYTSYIDKNEKQQDFLKRLYHLGYSVKTKDIKLIKTRDNRTILKGNVDIELALDAYRLSSSYKTLILLSGDSDFSYLIDLLKQKKKRIVVMSTRGHISKELLERSKYIDLRKLKEFIMFKESKKNQELLYQYS